jgi:hypothetical protein
MPAYKTPTRDDWRLHFGVAHSEASKPPDTEMTVFAQHHCGEGH